MAWGRSWSPVSWLKFRMPAALPSVRSLIANVIATARALTAMVKLLSPNWPVYGGPRMTLGRAANNHTKLARERNPYLRYWFGQAAHSLRRSQPDYAHYYLLKSQEGSPSPRKRALVLTARKAVRLVFALLHKAQSDHLEEGPTA